MLEESETEEKIGFVVIIFIIGDISIAGSPAPLAAGPAPRGGGGNFGAVPRQITACAPQRKIWSPKRGLFPKKVTNSVALECSLGPESPKMLVINPVFVSKNRFCAYFAMKTFFFYLHLRIRKILRIFCKEDLFLWSSPSNLRKKVIVPPQKNCLCPSSHATLAPGLPPATPMISTT